MPDIHGNVVRFAKEKGIPICKLEREAGLSAGSISKWKHIYPRTSSLISVAKVLKVPIEALLE